MSRSVRDPDYRQQTAGPNPYEDEEGRALVQAIHDRKNQGQRSLTCAKRRKHS